MAVGIYVLVDPKFSTFSNLANVNVTAVAGRKKLLFLTIFRRIFNS